MSFVSTNASIDSSHIKPIVNIHTNYIAVIPFGFMHHLNDPLVKYNANQQWFGETTEGINQYAQEFRKEKLKLMLKPQIWVKNGEFTGYIKMNSEEDWRNLEESYTKFILHFAELAERLKIEILCIGTELDYFQSNRPNYWVKLIPKIKRKYKGKLTYAANWDEYKRVKFWKGLDYIGVDAYFPLTSKETPSEKDCLEGWKTYKEALKSVSEIHEIPVLFTEYGYCSSDSAAHEPWRSDGRKVNLLGQLNATKALYTAFWDEEWFAGGFIWKWFHDHKNAGGINHKGHTPQNKPVENTIKERYQK